MTVLLITADSDDDLKPSNYEQLYHQLKQLRYSRSFSQTFPSIVRRSARRRPRTQQCLIKHLLTYMFTLFFFTNQLHWSILFLSVSSIKFMSTYALTTANSQCLPLEKSFVERICSKTCRLENYALANLHELKIDSLYLPFCSNHSLSHSIESRKFASPDLTENQCREMLTEVIRFDEQARKATQFFATYMQAIDSASKANRYSIIDADCLQAYRTWTCSVQIPYFHQNRRVPPCQTICDEVERVCPTFRPSERQPLFAGQPLFYCNGGLLANSDYGQRPFCFDTCHLGNHSVSSSSAANGRTPVDCFQIELLPLSLNESLGNQTSNTSLSSSARSIISSMSSSILVNLLTLILIERLSNESC